MKKAIPVLILISLCFHFINAQTGEIQQQINKDVWLPFMEAYATQDTEAFMALHSEDLIRIIRDGKQIIEREEYTRRMEQNSRRGKEHGVNRSIEFRFLERFAQKDLAFEVGYYKGRSQKQGEQENIFYGKFHVILKKVGGHWKLFVDSDTSQNDTIGEEDFRKGKLLNE